DFQSKPLVILPGKQGAEAALGTGTEVHPKGVSQWDCGLDHRGNSAGHREGMAVQVFKLHVLRIESQAGGCRTESPIHSRFKHRVSYVSFDPVRSDRFEVSRRKQLHPQELCNPGIHRTSKNLLRIADLKNYAILDYCDYIGQHE